MYIYICVYIYIYVVILLQFCDLVTITDPTTPALTVQCVILERMTRVC